MANRKPNTFSNCKECGDIFWAGQMEDLDELGRIVHERGGYYCEKHSKRQEGTN